MVSKTSRKCGETRGNPANVRLISDPTSCSAPCQAILASYGTYRRIPDFRLRQKAGASAVTAR